MDEDANSGFVCFQAHDLVDLMLSTQPVENDLVTPIRPFQKLVARFDLTYGCHKTAHKFHTDDSV